MISFPKGRNETESPSEKYQLFLLSVLFKADIMNPVSVLVSINTIANGVFWYQTGFFLKRGSFEMGFIDNLLIKWGDDCPLCSLSICYRSDLKPIKANKSEFNFITWIRGSFSSLRQGMFAVKWGEARGAVAAPLLKKTQWYPVYGLLPKVCARSWPSLSEILDTALIYVN